MVRDELKETTIYKIMVYSRFKEHLRIKREAKHGQIPQPECE